MAQVAEDDPRIDAPADTSRVLVVANQTLTGDALREEIKRQTHGRSAQVRVIVPAITSALNVAVGNVDGAIADARERLERELEEFRRLGTDATGDVGDSDPVLAIEDALRMFPADHLIISTLPEGESKWLERTVVDRARKQFDIPITHVIVDPSKNQQVTVEEVEPEIEDDSLSAYGIPKMPARDVAALLIGVIGTIALAILAATYDGNVSEGDMSAGGGIRTGLAIASGIVTVFHVSAILFFTSVRYRGIWDRLAAWMLIIGVPIAILVSALV